MKKCMILLAFLACFNANQSLKAELPENPTITSIIFDLDGVLITTSTMKTLSNLGIFNLLQYVFTTGSTLSKEALFDVLRPIPSVSKEYSEHQGKPMPGIMMDWQTGAQTNAQLLATCFQYFQEQYDLGNLSSAQITIFKQFATFMFDPTIYIESKMTISLNIKALETIAAYAKEHNIKLYILSNWDQESLPLLKTKFPEIFSHFNDENIMISGNVGLAKPNPKIYEYMLEKYHLHPATCLFIDDEPANIKAAQDLGMKTILCTPHVSKNLLLSIEKTI